MTMYESEKNFLERFADAIPGLKGYRAKEARRDTDKRLREYIAGKIDAIRREFAAVQSLVADEGMLELMDDTDKLDRRLQKVADGLRFASYGYSGFFDQVKIKEDELDQIYRFDRELLDDVERAGGAVEELKGKTISREALGPVDAVVSGLERRIAARKDLFNTPA